jgi:hypothetical protein
MTSREPKRFVLPYEPEYTAHRSDDRVCRTTHLHLHQREQVFGPPLAPELPGSDRSDSKKKLQNHNR